MIKNKDSAFIKKLMKDYDYNQKTLAERLCISKQYINHLINGRKTISKKLYNKIFECFPDTKPSDLKKISLPESITKEYIEQFRKYYGYSQSEISKLLEISQACYALIVSGKRNITDDIKQRIELLSENPKETIDVSQLDKDSLIRIKYQPNVKLDDNFYISNTERTVYFDKRLIGKKDYDKLIIASIADDSMSPKYCLGDKVVLDLSYKELEDGKVLAFKYNNKTFVRQIKTIKNKIKCTAFNKKYDTFYLDEYVDILGEILNIRL